MGFALLPDTIIIPLNGIRSCLILPPHRKMSLVLFLAQMKVDHAITCSPLSMGNL